MSALESLEKTRDEMISYLKEQAMDVFFGQDVTPAQGVEIQWNRDSWKDFVGLAKKGGVSLMILEEQLLTKNDLEELVDLIGAEKLKDFVNGEDLSKLQEFKSVIGSVKLTWIKEGVKFSYNQSTEWFSEFQDLRNSLLEVGEGSEEELARSSPITTRPTFYGTLPPKVKETPPEVLAEEMVTFITKEYDGLSTETFYSASRLFWEKKGVPQFGDPEVGLLKAKVERIVEQKIMGAEKERLPQLVEATVEWCEGNGFRKLTKQNLKAFLAEKNESLSKPSEDILLTRVNVKLAQ